MKRYQSIDLSPVLQFSFLFTFLIEVEDDPLVDSLGEVFPGWWLRLDVDMVPRLDWSLCGSL